MITWSSYIKHRRPTEPSKNDPNVTNRADSTTRPSMTNLARNLNLKKQNRFHQTVLIYSTYRFVLSCILCSVYFISLMQDGVSGFNNSGYYTTSLIYISTSLILLIYDWINRGSSLIPPLTGIIIDVTAITLLTYFNTTAQNNLSILLVVVIAASSILFESRLSTFIAAISTLAILGEHLFSIANNLSDQDPFSIPIGLLGISFFGTSILSQEISRRLRESEQLAFKQATDIEELRHLNELILQRMRTGIILVSPRGEVMIHNHSAYAALGINESNGEHKLSLIAPELWENLLAWQKDKNQKKTPLYIKETGTDLSASYSLLNHQTDSNIIIFLENLDRIRQQAQNIKLASLGKLAASIAHEIRNPLGAISHAAQLLSEGESLVPGDKVMLDIIQNQSVRINGIIENVLSLSRRKHAQPKLMKLADWLKAFIEDFKSYTPTPIAFKLIMNQDPEIQFDPSHLAQIMTNLTENAVHYGTSASNHTQLHLTINVDTQAESAFLDIQDNGQGINERDIEHIFEPFFTTGMTGTGLGLYLCRELCELNQARLTYIDTAKRDTANRDTEKRDTEKSSDYATEDALQGACFRIVFAHAKKHIITHEA